MKRKWMIWIAAALRVSLAACTGQSIVENKTEIIETEEVTTQPQTESCIVISPEDLAGPWHLDSEKNNLDAITTRGRPSLAMVNGVPAWKSAAAVK